MKTRSQLSVVCCLMTGFIALASACLMAAEPGPEGPRRAGDPSGAPSADGPRGRPFPGQFQGPGFQGGGGGGLPFESILTQDQRRQFGEEMQGQRDKLRELNEKSMRLRRELEDVLFGEKLDESLVRKKTTELSELEAERSLIRARIFAKLRPTFTEEQLERLKQMRMNRPGEGGFRPQFQPRPARPPADRGDEEVLPPPRPASPPPQK